ncbi:hypothetical protein CFC21_099128 [Triticum aestivum]|uniref:Uncharacterized protein n=3 Tax=Triticum TaxID=4564 RepID=A0A9R1L536_WHEAT|nr:GDSL esterase/lipase At3g14820-like [Triticum dicoccoides]XP_044407832.1 GDSL esterase/lipase At3g14820-like [Triticum aestivum]KAF7077950.1 hypothetical protein CFC21_082441 [Triticum aestivum]KAF7097293.1 hypothetical protein CFC21_099128 [Triticum aestivum]VAI43367.1 unnamed protein product [Triticum turgidum subsp. durum]
MAVATASGVISALLVLAGVAVTAQPHPAAGGPPATPPPAAGATPPPAVGPPKAPPLPAGPPKFPAILAFGDSVADTGNNNHLRTFIRSNFPPYGKDFPGHKHTGRFSNGKISVDLLASALGVKELLPPYLKKGLSIEELKTGVSFASAGNGFDNATCRTMSALTMERQLQLFQEYKEKVGGSVPDKALYFIVTGSNDIVEHFTFADGITEPGYAESMVSRAIAYVQSLADLGAKRIALVGAPPVGCLPSQRMIAGGLRKQCATDRNQLALLFNHRVGQEMAKLGVRLPGVTLVNVDIYTILADVIYRPEAFGLNNTHDACCGYIGLAAAVLCNFASPLCKDPSKYLFWDSYHPTERGYQILIDAIVAKYFRFMH